MTTQPSVITISDFTAAKQSRLFGLLKQSQFNGQLELTAGSTKWTFDFYMGRLLYVTGGKQPMRRWYRYVRYYCPDLYVELSTLKSELRKLSEAENHRNLICWEYQLLGFWYSQQKISREQISKIVENIFLEVFFDISQAREVVYQVHTENQLSNQLLLINADAIIHKAQHRWKSWLKARLGERSPDLAPIIRHPLELKRQLPEPLYRSLTMMLTGQQTLRDICVKIERDIISLSASLLPYVQQGSVELGEIDDLEVPISLSTRTKESSNGPLIACIDDSPAVCRALEKVLDTANYCTHCIQDPLRAIGILLSKKPSLIFLDLIMPETNGYELCSQLRKISCFKETPIVILTGNDGVIDRMRAKMAGASAFLSKPINPHQVLSVVKRELSKQPSNDI